MELIIVIPMHIAQTLQQALAVHVHLDMMETEHIVLILTNVSRTPHVTNTLVVSIVQVPSNANVQQALLTLQATVDYVLILTSVRYNIVKDVKLGRLSVIIHLVALLALVKLDLSEMVSIAKKNNCAKAIFVVMNLRAHVSDCLARLIQAITVSVMQARVVPQRLLRLL